MVHARSSLQGGPKRAKPYAPSCLADADRFLRSVLRPDGVTVSYTPDSFGRLSQIGYPQGTVGYNYLASTGQLGSTTTPAGETTTFTYDGFLTKSIAWSGTGVVSGSITFGYNSAFRVYSQTLNSSAPLLFGYDNDAVLISAGAIAITPDPQNGRLSATALGNATDAYTYDSDGLLATYTAKYSGSAIYTETIVSRYADGRIQEKTDNVSGTTHDWKYTYDPAGRLTQAKLDNTSSPSNYTYDGDDNRITYPGSTTAPTYDVQDRLLSYVFPSGNVFPSGSATFAYTANGELSSKTIGSQVWNYTHDALGNLLHVGLPAALPDGVQTVDYVVDGQNRRVGKKINGASAITNGWLYQDQLRIVAQLDGSNNVVERFVYGSKPNVPDYLVTYNTSGTALGTFRILSDHLSSPRLVVDISNGNVVETMSYDEFGNETENLNSPPTGYLRIPFGFAGGFYDPDTGLVRFGARDYDASVGRWTSKDPIRFRGGMNLYRYIGNDPINGNDPSGRANLCGGNPTCIALGVAFCRSLCGINAACYNWCVGPLLPEPPAPDNSGVFEHCYVIPELEDGYACYYVCPSEPIVAVPKGQPTDGCNDDHWRPTGPNSCQ